MTMGILLPGTRTRVLNHLAAHLIWFKHQSAAVAASFLTTWAMSPRHASKDIAADLANGTTIVANHILHHVPLVRSPQTNPGNRPPRSHGRVRPAGT